MPWPASARSADHSSLSWLLPPLAVSLLLAVTSPPPCPSSASQPVTSSLLSVSAPSSPSCSPPSCPSSSPSSSILSLLLSPPSTAYPVVTLLDWNSLLSQFPPSHIFFCDDRVMSHPVNKADLAVLHGLSVKPAAVSGETCNDRWPCGAEKSWPTSLLLPPSYNPSSPVRYVHQLLCIEPVAIHCWCVHCQWRLLLITVRT